MIKVRNKSRYYIVQLVSLMLKFPLDHLPLTGVIAFVGMMGLSSVVLRDSISEKDIMS